MALKLEVASAIDEIRLSFPDATVDVREDGEGGAFVTVSPVDLGAVYVQRETWIGFHITFQYPYSDVYPHFIRGDLTCTDRAPHGSGMTAGRFEDRAAIQLSRRSNHLDPEIDTAVIKLWKVLTWLRNR
jgi:hypothetical protein